MDARQVDRYLERIGYGGLRKPSLEILRELQLAHMLAVPFENLDIHWGRRIVLDEDALYGKIVEERRGGFCYELNGLFCALLRALGFEVTMISARVADAEGLLGPEFDHMALLVPIDGLRWLADVGFGESSRWPLDLDERSAQRFAVNLGRMYRIEDLGGGWGMSHESRDGAWRPGYTFTLEPRTLRDFEPMCAVQQTSPDSHFVKNRICSLATGDGRVSLTDARLVVTKDRQRIERAVGSAEWNRVLREEFGIDAQSE